MKRWGNTEKVKITGTQVLGILFLLVIWEIGVRISGIEPYILPTPSRVLASLVEGLPLIAEHTKVTLYEAMAGFTAAVIFSFIAAFAMDSIPVFKDFLYPILVVSQTVPIITVAPLFLIWFGYGLLPKIFVAFLVCFFPVTVSLIEGLESADREIYNLLKSMGASKMQIFRLVKLPGAMPSLFSGLKISAAYSIMGAVIGEWLGARAGLGEFMRRSMHSFAVDRTFTAILVTTLLSLAVFWFISFLEVRLMPWARFMRPDGE